MDKRNWLWRGKSSERSPSGETESTGSLSSHSERISEDQTSSHNIQSPEVTSKAVSGNEEQDESLKTLSEKLSEALLEIRAKEDLVKQHSKVAEEAVTGWERAENEVSILKKQTEVLTQKNSILEERIGNVDGALKECLRQLRQAWEDQEEKIYDAVAKKSREWELTRSELQNQIAELHSQLQDARTDASSKQKENSLLKINLISIAEELELRTSERDLSSWAAESASRQHLESIKKVTKLEAECRRLKIVARKSILGNDHKSVSASSVFVESLTDSQSDSGERILVIESESSNIDGLKSTYDHSCQNNSLNSSLHAAQIYDERTVGTSFSNHSVDIDLMDDFLEMERLVALPETQSVGDHHPTVANDREDHLKNELEAMINWTTVLEENLKKMRSETLNLEMDLTESQIQIKKLEDQLKQTEASMVELSTQLTLANLEKGVAQKEVAVVQEKLKNSTKLLHEAKVDVLQTRDQLIDSNEAKRSLMLELENANIKKAEAESQLNVVKLELETLRPRVFSLEEEVDGERMLSSDAVSKCKKLETEISRMKLESKFQRLAIVEEFRVNQDKELAVAASKFADCQNTIASLDRQLKSLASFDDFFIDSEN